MTSRLVLNLKMHEVSVLLPEYIKFNVPLDVLVPAPYLEQASRVFKGSLVSVGAQNISAQIRGAYTGQVSCEMLQHFGVPKVLLGHQEVEDSIEVLKQKLALAQQAGLEIVFCVSGHVDSVELVDQLDCIGNLGGIAVAYEPIGSIGSGNAAGVESIDAAVRFIKSYLQEKFSSNFGETTVLYGGSVNNNNCREILSQTQVDGLLIGGASLDMAVLREVIEICKQF